MASRQTMEILAEKLDIILNGNLKDGDLREFGFVLFVLELQRNELPCAVVSNCGMQRAALPAVLRELADKIDDQQETTGHA